MKRFLRQVRWVLLIVALAAVAVFIIQNAAVVELRFLNLTLEARRFHIVGGSLLLGALVGWVFGASSR
jgi:uncharacterized integral membrane protein